MASAPPSTAPAHYHACVCELCQVARAAATVAARHTPTVLRLSTHRILLAARAHRLWRRSDRDILAARIWRWRHGGLRVRATYSPMLDRWHLWAAPE